MKAKPASRFFIGPVEVVPQETYTGPVWATRESGDWVLGLAKQVISADEAENVRPDPETSHRSTSVLPLEG